MVINITSIGDIFKSKHPPISNEVVIKNSSYTHLQKALSRFLCSKFLGLGILMYTVEDQVEDLVYTEAQNNVSGTGIIYLKVLYKVKPNTDILPDELVRKL